MALPIVDVNDAAAEKAHKPYDESVGNFEWASEVKPSQNLISKRFVTGGRGRPWTQTTDADWNDWRWQQRNRVTRLEQLEKVVTVTDEERTAFAKSDAMFHMGITPYYAALKPRPEFEPGTLLPEDRLLHRGSGAYHAAKR